MNEQLKDMFQEQARIKRFKVMQSILACKQQENGSMGTNVLKLKGYFNRIQRLSFPFTQESAIDGILNSLTNA